MDNIKTVTPREIKQITNATCKQPKIILWHGKRIRINPLLYFKDFFDLIGDIVTHCVTDNKLIVESVDFVFKSKTVEKYGNLILPEEFEDKYKTIYGTDLVDCVFNEINVNQLNALKQIIKVYTGIEL